MTVSALYARNVTAYQVRKAESKAATAHRKLLLVLDDVVALFGSCNLRDDAAHAELVTRRLVERLGDVRTGRQTP